MEFGVYVHFPWCRRRCPYCDFAIAVAPLEEIPHQVYADAVLAELADRRGLFSGKTLGSIYFGGGTPALWHPEQIRRVIVAVSETFAKAPQEVTVEANPNDCTPAVLGALLSCGVNRLSVGTQAFDDDALLRLGRDHLETGSLESVQTARAAGFTNVTVDLIFALPGRKLTDWERTLDAVLRVAPDHLSSYQLTVEERTTFGESLRRGRMTERPDDDCADEFLLADERLSAAGYEHYEVSSYAKPGFRSRHNSLYWQAAEYLGLGSGAHSFWRPEGGTGVRWSNHRSVVRYLAAALPSRDLLTDLRVASVEKLDAEELAEDALWLGMRTKDGVRADAFPSSVYERGLALGLLARLGDRVQPTSRGLLFADEIATMLLQ